MNDNLENLLRQGQVFTFINNSDHYNTNGIFSKASDELLGWTANVEQFIIENYGEESGPYKLFKRFDSRYLNEYGESEFTQQLNILKGALISCKSITPINKKKNQTDNLILSLIKNQLFWVAIVVLISGAFAIGLHFGTSKFDKEKSDYYEENKVLKSRIESINSKIKKRDSIIIIKENYIKRLELENK
jgi:hypothetical protein